MNTSHEVAALIIGAGPTGLTAALELSRLGVGVRIVDRASERSLTSRALGIQARTVELLRVRGIGNELVELGNPAGSTTLYSEGRRLAGIELHRMPSEFNYVLLLAQSETERLLTEQLNRQGVKVERGVELLTVTQRQDSVSAVLRSGDGAQEVVDASYLIAADGSRSAIRKALGLAFTGKSLTHNYVLGDLHLAVEHDVEFTPGRAFLEYDVTSVVFVNALLDRHAAHPASLAGRPRGMLVPNPLCANDAGALPHSSMGRGVALPRSAHPAGANLPRISS